MIRSFFYLSVGLELYTPSKINTHGLLIFICGTGLGISRLCFTELPSLVSLAAPWKSQRNYNLDLVLSLCKPKLKALKDQIIFYIGLQLKEQDEQLLRVVDAALCKPCHPYKLSVHFCITIWRCYTQACLVTNN